jgi:ABC-type branched-subunit amino acid transport system substrate-binding protein
MQADVDPLGENVMRFLKNFAFSAAMIALGTPVLAADGVAPDTVRFAQVAALEGPAAALGSGMRAGILAAFEEANRSGGVHGRTVG